jgi:hypothetical protein
MRAHSLVALFLAACCFVSASAQSNVAAAQKGLLQMPAAEMDTDVPAAVQQGIEVLKQALADASDGVMHRLPAGADAAAAKAAVVAALPPAAVGHDATPSAGGDADSKPAAGFYGGSLTVDVQQAEPSLLLLRESFGIMCGEDTLLLVYRAEGNAWHRVLRWQSDRYGQISGAFGDVYETRLLQPHRNGHPLLLAIHGTPWCTSTMSGFAMDVFELGAPGNKPMWHGDHSYRRADDLFQVKTTPDGFEIRTSVNSFGDERDSRVSRTGIIRYAVRPDGVHRVEPIALNAAESLEEWLDMPRNEAAEFADGPAASPLWKLFDTVTWHDKPEATDRPLPSYGSLHACRDDKRHFQMNVALQHYTGRKMIKEPSYFVQIVEVANGYRMHSAALQPDANCTGTDLLVK